jgi:hypothetical protein
MSTVGRSGFCPIASLLGPLVRAWLAQLTVYAIEVQLFFIDGTRPSFDERTISDFMGNSNILIDR